MATQLTIKSLSDALGGEVSGIDLSRPLEDDALGWIEDALDAHQVLVFHDQSLDPSALAAFGRRLGTPRPHALEHYRHPDHEDVSYIRNVDDAGNFDSFGQVRATTWHTDSTYEVSLPRLAILHALEIPASGGGTYFANMCAAYEGLSAEVKQRIAPLVGLHSYATGPAGTYYEGQLATHQDYPEQRRPAVVPHPRTGRQILFVNPMHVHGFDGMDQADAFQLVEELAAHSVQERFVYHHAWRAGDVLMWDEQATMHRGAGDSAPGERRVLLRTIIYPD